MGWQSWNSVGSRDDLEKVVIKYDQPKVPWPAKKLRVSSWPLTRKEFHSEKDGTFPSNSDVGQYYVMVLQPTQKKNVSHYVQKSELPGRRRRRRSYSSQCSSFEQKTIYSSKLYVLGFLPQALHDAAFPHLVSKKKENESSWAEVGTAIYGWFQTIFVSLSPRTLGKMNIDFETKVASQPSYQRSRPKPAMGERGAMDRATCTRRRGFLCSAFDDGEWTMAS